MPTIQLTVQKKNDTTFLLVDTLGYICGVFATEQQATDRAPIVLANILAGKIPARLHKVNPYRPQQTGKKFYKNKRPNKTKN